MLAGWECWEAGWSCWLRLLAGSRVLLAGSQLGFAGWLHFVAAHAYWLPGSLGLLIG
jgi:hypothetical protein